MDYIVLALKYRPSKISELKGQDVLVETLKNAFELNRVPHAFILTGIRGTGKTTTARIMAKALNCIGKDGLGGITLEPCNECEHCRAINNSNHLDVIEMDAASKTSVDDVREIIENVKYKPATARYKVYIIDEVHMLSKNAFNALLKTLEEPPTHVKFIFATTEIKKVPITVISRCQKFELKRISLEDLKKHLAYICNAEGITFEDEALELIAKTAEGSARDSLSILDQAISSSNKNLTTKNIFDLLGHSNREGLYYFFNALIESNEKETISYLNNEYNSGKDLITIFEDLLEICHLITMMKLAPAALEDLALSDGEKTEGLKIAEKVSVSVLIFIWQVFLKGIEEIKNSHFQKKTAEMLVIRIIWANSIPSLEALAKKIEKSASTNLTSQNSVSAPALKEEAPKVEAPTPTYSPKVEVKEVEIKAEEPPFKMDSAAESIIATPKAPETIAPLEEAKPGLVNEVISEEDELKKLFPNSEKIDKN